MSDLVIKARSCHAAVQQPCSLHPAPVSSRQSHALSFAFVNQDQQQPPTAHESLGGPLEVRELVNRFYSLMNWHLKFAAIRMLHAAPLNGSRNKLAWSSSVGMGGHDRYTERSRNPRLRACHLPFPFAAAERDACLRCMAWALRDLGIDDPLQLRLMQSFHQTDDWMRHHAG